MNDLHYTYASDADTHETLLCVQTGKNLSDPNRFKFEGHEHYLKSASEMRYLFRHVPEACDNTLWVAERADLTIEFGKPQHAAGVGLRHGRGAIRAASTGGATPRRPCRAPGLPARLRRGANLLPPPRGICR